MLSTLKLTDQLAEQWIWKFLLPRDRVEVLAHVLELVEYDETFLANITGDSEFRMYGQSLSCQRKNTQLCYVMKMIEIAT